MKHLFFLFFGCISISLWSQQFPVESQVVVRPPSSVYLSDFTELGSQRLEFVLDFRDNNEPEYDVRLHLKLEGNGVVLETSPNYQPTPITLFPGGPRSLDMMEWADYLDPGNLTLIGLDQMTFLSQGGKLPEGMYELCLTVRDYRRPEVDLSRQNCTILSLRKNNPPLPFVPTCGGVVQPNPNNQVQLNWQANHDALVNAQYTIDMVKVEPDQDPNQAIISSSQRLLPDVVINNQTSYTIDPSDPMSTPLVFGETYAYRINVTDLDGLTTFENDGQGEVCWFSYGFLPGGVLGINYPLQDTRVNPNQPLTFNWNAPANVVAGNQIYYRIRVADVSNGSDPVAALESAALLLDEQTPPTSNLGSWNYTYEGTLETERDLAWIVEAFADGDESGEPLASSEVTVFRTTPLIDQFRAGQYTVLVNTAGNSTIDDFSGTGTVQVNDTLNLDVAFENLVIEQLATANVLLEGVIDYPIEEEWPLENADEGNFFLANRLLLDRNDLKIEGRVRHAFGLIANSNAPNPGPVTYIQSPVLLLSFEGGVMDGASGNFEDIDLQPIDLNGLEIQYRSCSYTIANGAIDYVLNGAYRLDAPVSYMGQEAVEFVFAEKASFYNLSLTYPGRGQILRLTREDSINLMVKELVVDLRYDESPVGSGQDEQWIGFYVNEGSVDIPTNFDALGAIIPLEEISFSLSDVSTPVLFTPTLNLEIDYTFPESTRPRASFYGFLDDWHQFQLSIENGSVTAGQLDGDVYIPFLNEETPFEYTVGISDDGTEAAWLSSLDGYTLELEGKENVADELTLFVLSGSFAENDRLVLNTDVYFSAFDATFENMSGLTLWGDGAVGFDGVKHGIKNASDHIQINVNNFPGNLKSFGISAQLATETVDEDQAAPDGQQVWDRRMKYLFVYEADVNFGMFLSSVVPGNAPKTAFSLSTYRDISVLLPEDYVSEAEVEATTMPDYWTDLWEAQEAQEAEATGPINASVDAEAIPFLLASVASSALPGVANVTVGDLRVLPYDETYGALFALQAEIEMLRPFAFRIQINVFAGHTPWIDTPDGFAYTAVKLGLKDGTEGGYVELDNHLSQATTRSVLLNTTTDSFTEMENATSNNRFKIGPLSIRYLALGVYINMDYDNNGKLEPAQGRYGGLLSFNGRMNVPPDSDGLGQGFAGNAQVGKRRVEFNVTAELIISSSWNVTYAHGILGANYTENVSSADAGNGGNYIKFGLEGSFDWDSQLFRSQATFDMWYPPLCVVANAGFDFQLHPETKELRMLNVRLGSYENRITVEQCAAVEQGGGNVGGGISVGGSYGLVCWLDVLMKYGLPSAQIPFGYSSYTEFDEDLSSLDDQIAALEALPPSERQIIETALTNPSDLPDEIRNDPDFSELLLGYQDTYGTKILSGEVGLGLTASIEARTDEWIDLLVIRFIPFVNAEVSLVGWGNVQILPAFALNEIGVELNGNAQLGAYYQELDGLEYSGNVKTWIAADITIIADGVYNVLAQQISGSLSAQIQFIQLPGGGYLVDVTADVPYEFSTAAN